MVKKSTGGCAVVALVVIVILFVIHLISTKVERMNSVSQEGHKEASVYKSNLNSSQLAIKNNVNQDSLLNATSRADSIYRVVQDSIDRAKLIKECNYKFYLIDGSSEDLGAKLTALRNNSNEIYFKRYKKLYPKIKAIQIKIFPYFRKEFASMANSKLWIADGAASVRGSRDEILRLVSSDFVSHQNIQNSYDAIIGKLEELRFKRVEFLWYKYDDDYTYYKINSPSDVDSF